MAGKQNARTERSVRSVRNLISRSVDEVGSEKIRGGGVRYGDMVVTKKVDKATSKLFKEAL